MSMRKRMSLGSIIGKRSDEGVRVEGGASTEGRKRRSSPSPSLSWVESSGKKINWATEMMQRGLAAAAVVVDKALFVDVGDEQDDEYGTKYAQRSQSQRAEFEAR